MLIITVALWTAVCIGSMTYHVHDLRRHIVYIANETARESIEKDMLYRYWAAGHGGIYVPVTETTRPNPYLVNVKERDITTPSGRRLTLMNPAYMTRQVHELGTLFTEVQGHITSLKPIRPENAPDAWERKALGVIESGAKEFGETTEFRGTPHYRLMLPLPTDPPCLKCHEAQGYKLGDLRGGISASIPMSIFSDVFRDHLLSEAKHFGVIWVLGLAGAFMVAPYVRRRIEERERAEETLRRNWEFTQSIIDNEPECVKILGPGGEVKFMNRAGLAMIDAESIDTVLGKPVQQLVVPEHRDAFVRLGERVFAGERGSLEFEVVGLKGTRRWLETQAVPLWGKDGPVESLLGITRDVTDRKEVQQELESSAARYRQLFDGNPHPMWVYDRSTLAFLTVNDAAVQRYGYTQEEFLAMTIAEIRPEEDVARLQETVKQRSAGILRTGPWRHRTKDGTIIDVEITSHTLTWEGRDAVLVLVTDITERKLAEERRKQLEQQLLQAQKIESVGRLAGGIAHDINNMLTPILGYAELLEHKLPAGDGGREDLAEITSAAMRVRDMTQQLLAFARKQTLEMVRLDLNDVVTGFTRMLQMTLRENIVITVRCAPSVRPILGDKSRLEQVIMNLAVNAQDAMPAGGTFTLVTQDLVVDAEYATTRTGMAPGTYVQLLAIDTGTGMDEVTRSKIFDPFFTTKEAGRGTGLGLAMVYGIVKQHGGYIEVRSEPDAGTAFIISLPAQEAPAGEYPTAVKEQEQNRGTETVLVVEDQEQVLRLVSLMLTGRGYRVLAALSGREALRTAAAFAGDIHLVVSDVIMSDMNGKELYERLREARPGLEILYISGYPADVISTHGVLDSGINFLPKPFNVQEFAAKVRQVLDGRGRDDADRGK